MCLVVEDEPVRAATLAAAQLPTDALKPGRVRLKVFDLDGLVGLTRVLDHLGGLAGLHDLGGIPVDGIGLLLRQPMPVGDHHLATA